jgi:hypothetical protein
MVQRWSQERHKSVPSDERSGHPTSHRTDENVEKVWNLVHSQTHLSITAMAVQLNLDKEAVKKALNLGPTIGISTMPILQLTRHSMSSSFWPKNQSLKWNTYHIPLTSSCFQK